MNKLSLGLLAASFCASSLAAGTAVDFKAYAQRVPALPTTSAAASAAFSYDAKTSQIPVPPAIVKLHQDIEAAVIAVSTTAPGAAAPGTMTPEQAEAMQKKLQSMSQAEQIAYAMQLQQQMTAGASGFSVTPAENAAVQKLQAQQIPVNDDEQKLIALRQRVDQLLSAWDSAVPGSAQFALDNSYVFCDEVGRAKSLAEINARIQQSDQQLIKAAALDRELRTTQAAFNARAELAAGLATQIHSQSFAGVAATSTRAAGHALDLIDVTADFYEKAGRRAARWSLQSAAMKRAPLMAKDSGCKDGSGL